MARTASPYNPVLPKPETVKFAQDLVRQLRRDGVRFALLDRESGKATEIDETVYRLIQQLLVDLAQNRAVSIIPIDHELTSHQAADLLNVSRPYLIGLLDQGKIPYRMVGTHRRIRLEDLLAYKDEARAESDKALDEIVKDSQDMDLY
jgi:excisionase family DNA binding protein